MLHGFKYRKKIVITNPSANVFTDWPVRVAHGLYPSSLYGAWHFKDSLAWIRDTASNNLHLDAINYAVSPNQRVGSAAGVNGGLAGNFSGSMVATLSGGVANRLSSAEASFSVWLKPSSSGWTGNVFAKTYNSGWRCRVETDGKLLILDRGSTNILYSTVSIPINQWTHVVFVGSSSGLRIYINGQLNSSNAVAFGGGTTTTGNFTLGADSNTTLGEFYQGAMDEALYFGKALTPDEVSYLYSLPFNGEYQDIRYTDSDGETLLDWYPYSDSLHDVKIPTLAGNSTKTIWLYYGNGLASQNYNGANVYSYFDDFKTNTLANYTSAVVTAGWSAGNWQYRSDYGMVEQYVTTNPATVLKKGNFSLPSDYEYIANLTVFDDPNSRHHAGIVSNWSTTAETGYRLVTLDANAYFSKFLNGTETQIYNVPQSIFVNGKFVNHRIIRKTSDGSLRYDILDGFNSLNVYYQGGYGIETTYNGNSFGIFSYQNRTSVLQVVVRKYTDVAISVNVESQSSADNLVKVFVSGLFQLKPLRRWNGSSWEDKPVKVYNGSAWS